MPGSKGGLYLWEDVRRCSEVILVEGLFDYAVLWQAGIRNVTCSLGNHLNARQFQQLCDNQRTVYLAFDADANGSGARASQSLSRRLWAQRVSRGAWPFQMVMTRTAFSSRAAMQNSSASCWRRLVHEVSCH